jgi:hypothetical protein
MVPPSLGPLTFTQGEPVECSHAPGGPRLAVTVGAIAMAIG